VICNTYGLGIPQKAFTIDPLKVNHALLAAIIVSENIVMTDIQLDLENERCPMSLLLVKRAYKQLETQQVLRVRIVDAQSIRDCRHDLIKQNAMIDCTQEHHVTVMTISKRKDSEC